MLFEEFYMIFDSIVGVEASFQQTTLFPVGASCSHLLLSVLSYALKTTSVLPLKMNCIFKKFQSMYKKRTLDNVGTTTSVVHLVHPDLNTAHFQRRE